MSVNEVMCDCNIIHEDVVNNTLKKMLPQDLFDKLAEFFKIIGDPTRTKILFALDQNEMCVCDAAGLQQVHELVDDASHDPPAAPLEDDEHLLLAVDDAPLQERERLRELVGNRGCHALSIYRKDKMNIVRCEARCSGVSSTQCPNPGGGSPPRMTSRCPTRVPGRTS